jgi:hypothetical protein
MRQLQFMNSPIFVLLDFFLVAYVLLLILAGLLIYVSAIKNSVKGTKKKEYQEMEFGDDDKVYYVDFDFKKSKKDE